jgi:hypothetical protein
MASKWSIHADIYCQIERERVRSMDVSAWVVSEADTPTAII